jgi:2-methylcitrate dehydratase
LKTEADFHAATRQRLLAVSAALLEALYDAGAVAVLATLRPADMLPGGARVPGTSYELEPATAARAMRALLALRGVQADALIAALAQADQLARYALLAGQPPPTLASLYQHCTRDIQAAGSDSLEEGLKALVAAAERIFTPPQARRIAMLCQAVRSEPQNLDAMPVQQFVAGLVRNSP